MSKRHSLKNWLEPFAALWNGVKVHEFRKNDRDYQVGDSLQIMEWDENRQQYTGRFIGATIKYMTTGPAFGVPDGHCVMSLEIWAREQKHPQDIEIVKDMQLRVGELSLFRHDYDGKVVALVRNGKQAFINEEQLDALITSACFE